MKDLLDKLSSYNLFNYLFPGIIFAVIASKITHYSFIQQDVVTGAFLYYFIGLVISRFGSLVIEPIIKSRSFIKYSDYDEFVTASKKDDKVNLFLEISNTYRTLCSLFIILLFLKLYEWLERIFPFLQKWNFIILAVLLFVLFLFSYRKQTDYITKRIKAVK